MSTSTAAATIAQSSLFTSDIYEISTNLEKINGSIKIKNVSCDDLMYVILNHMPPKEKTEDLSWGTGTDTLPVASEMPPPSLSPSPSPPTFTEDHPEEEVVDAYASTDPIFYRSIILDPDRNILCYSPPNGMSIESLFEQYDKNSEDICVNEIIEGTMINLFYDTRKNNGNGGWEIATRSNIQCNNWFYRTEYNNVNPTQKTFQKMFFDCFGYDIHHIEEITYFDEKFNKNYCYSFVMQHPNNHIVLYCHTPTVYLVSVYEKLPENKIRFISPDEYESWDLFLDVPIYFPARMPSEKLAEDYKTKYCNLNSLHTFLGFMFTNKKTGERAALSNPVYEKVKELRGNNPNLQYHYFTLLKSNQVEHFLYYFPNYRGIFDVFREKYEYFITCVHQCYYSYYVKKENIPIYKDFFIHVSRIHHQIFLTELAQGRKKIITRKVVKEYFDSLSPSSIVYALQYEIRYLQRMKEQNEEKYNDVLDTNSKTIC
jgi:hypothetical protein